MEIKSTRTTITCCKKDGRYRWIRDDGEPCSPILGSEQEAKDYANSKPLITLDEQVELLTDENKFLKSQIAFLSKPTGGE